LQFHPEYSKKSIDLIRQNFGDELVGENTYRRLMKLFQSSEHTFKILAFELFQAKAFITLLRLSEKNNYSII
jgi:hypothetical protein